MFPTLSLHLSRLASRHKIRYQREDPERVDRLLRYYVRSLPALLDAERCNILVYSPGDQRAWVEVGTHAPVGEYFNPSAVKKGVTGIVFGPGNFYWNIRKN